ncbi:DUF654-domain-containing protein [Melanomma pulvis-pyrius CBS 109.77]|uniref:DUF654-domain-containing protein n=1 Tax=Melanomma pulvis-pyrius CBS 109.77 TaxID=1314802 RepID=A0A6A6XXH7_9PLEO|nr:DUF654-domain-containing protein [Melanomma pulvis-pyrius CBS 109.77]
MSSRALRRAQKEREEREQHDALRQEDEEDESDQDVAPAPKPRPSLFALLGDTGDDDNDDDEEEDKDENVEPETAAAPVSRPSQKSKRKKKKGKGKAKVAEPETTPPSSKLASGLDEIDLALHALNLTSQAEKNPDSDQLISTISGEMLQLYSVLAVDTQHLHAANEMRKLFGRAAAQGADNDEPARARRRGRGRGQQQGGIPGNQHLTSIVLRRNIFIQGKEGWPRATLGGLSMEVVEKRSDGSVEYRFMHNTTYQSVQREFEICVASMDPERMLQLLSLNPYHISTLLQVSEISKQQQDNASSFDLLERALFSFGRAVHSTFANNLSQGKARLDFRRPENREFFLAVWRYVHALGVRSTWRTAFEWAKLLLSMSPEDDPYCIRLLIDQLALRGREPQGLVDLVESDHLQRLWKIPPNLAMSVALAHDRLKNPEKARLALKSAIKQYAWIAARLCKELEITPIPKSVWGKEPIGDQQELLCQLYVPRAKDLWNTPESTSLLVEVAYSFEEELDVREEPYWLADMNELDIARLVILSDDRSLLSLLDQKVKAKYTSTSDPLPPENSISSYNVTGTGNQELQNISEDQLFTELERLRVYFANIDLGRHLNANGGMTQEDLQRVLQEAQSTFAEFRRNTERVQALRARLQDFGVQVVFDGEDGEGAREEASDSSSDADE